jgi:hypothetical protein
MSTTPQSCQDAYSTRPAVSRSLPLVALAVLALASLSGPVAAQTTSRLVVVTQSGNGHFGAGALRNTRTTVISQTIVERAPAPRSYPGAVIPVNELPVVVGIRRPPVAPPSVIQVPSPRTAMHSADEKRMSQNVPGARTIQLTDTDLSSDTRRRYVAFAPGEARTAPQRTSGQRFTILNAQ